MSRATGGRRRSDETEADDAFGLPDWVEKNTLEADTQTITGQDLLLRSNFHLSSRGEGAHAGPAVTAWGRVATGGFETEEDGVTMDGDVTTAMIGFDAEWERGLAGVMLSQSRGKGSYLLDPELGEDKGTVESDLTGVYPYAKLDLNTRVSAWALAGAGSGKLTLSRLDDGDASGVSRGPGRLKVGHMPRQIGTHLDRRKRLPHTEHDARVSEEGEGCGRAEPKHKTQDAAEPRPPGAERRAATKTSGRREAGASRGRPRRC